MASNPLESRMSHLEGAYEQTSLRLASIDARFDALDRKVDLRFDALLATIRALDAKIDGVEDKLGRKIDGVDHRLDRKIDQRFMWLVGVVVGTWLTTIATVLLHH